MSATVTRSTTRVPTRQPVAGDHPLAIGLAYAFARLGQCAETSRCTSH